MRLESVAVWGLFGAGIGRLLAKDTICNKPRNFVMTRLLGVRTLPLESDMVKHLDDVAAEVRKGIRPLNSHDEVSVAAPDAKRALVASGLACPSCVSWHAVFWARVAIEPRGFLEARWWRDTFACWALAGILTRVGG